MPSFLQFEHLYKEIHSCRKCHDVTSSLITRHINEVACRSQILLMAQAPSEDGVRKSGIHWVGEDGRVRRPGGVFLDNYLKQLGYSVDPEVTKFARPYTTNVLHCWTERRGKRDRQPTSDELQNCRQWWEMEIELVRPRVIILLGKPAAECFSASCGDDRTFLELRLSQGEVMTFGNLFVRRYVVPHPTAPYPGKSAIYQTVTDMVAEVLR